MLRFVRPERPRFGPLEMMGAAGLALLLTARFVPLARWMPWWGCPLRETTGLPCLSCGMTRAFDWLMRGRLLDSFLINPLGFLLALLGAISALYLLLAPLRPPRPQLAIPAPLPLWVRLGLGGAIAGNWVYLVVRTLITGTI